MYTCVHLSLSISLSINITREVRTCWRAQDVSVKAVLTPGLIPKTQAFKHCLLLKISNMNTKQFLLLSSSKGIIILFKPFGKWIITSHHRPFRFYLVPSVVFYSLVVIIVFLKDRYLILVHYYFQGRNTLIGNANFHLLQSTNYDHH